MIEKLLGIDPDNHIARKAVGYLRQCLLGTLAFVALEISAIYYQPELAYLGGIALYYALMCQRMYVGWMSKVESHLPDLEPSDYAGIFLSMILRGLAAYSVTALSYSVIAQ
jgi:hypothetical protein